MVKRISIVCLTLLVTLSFLTVDAYGKGKPSNPGGKSGGGNPSVESALAFIAGRIGGAGIVDSYVEDGFEYSYLYDNALSAMAFISSGDLATAEIILDGLAAIGTEPEGGFLERYSSLDGSSTGGIPPAGPNAYVLMAINLYYDATGDPKYDLLAADIADFILTHQDTDGGLFGNASVTWKSVENNMAAYAAINNFGVLNNDQYYVDKAAEIKAFIINECWDGTRFFVAEGNSDIFTDVQALGTLILGADYSSGSTWVEGYTLNTDRYKGRKSVTGFDFNDDLDTVWTEGTFQETLAFISVGDVTRYAFYKAEGEKLYQSSGAFLLASSRGSTGFEWILEKWQAVAPTAWYVFVCNQDNVLEPM